MTIFRDTLICLFLTLTFLSVLLRYFEVRQPSVFSKYYSKRYLVDTEHCKIPYFNPFSSTKFEPLVDSGTRVDIKPPLTYIDYDWENGVTSLKINASVLKLYIKNVAYADIKQINCCVSSIYESYWPNIKLGRCEPFNETFTLDSSHEMIVVKCFDNQESLFYIDSHITVVKRLKKSKPSSRSKLNVLLIGLDSVSRLDMYRNMPNTVLHMHASGWVEMRGYNKVGDNTLPNLMALLTGLPLEEFNDLPGNCFFDSYPFIWKRFSSQDYVTAYAEDGVDIETFNGFNKGFFRKPTNYYPRSFFSFREKESRMKNKENGFNFQGSMNVLPKYIYDFVRTYRDDSFFGLFYTNAFHNGLQSNSLADDNLFELLERLESLGVFNNTVVVMFSDHGKRVGTFRTSTAGWYEDRLPLLFISVPEWFELKNKSVFSNLLDNSEILTSPFDLYMTLENILEPNPDPPKGCPSCKSLFDTLETTRSCAEAGISRHWCTCEEFLDFDIDERIQHLIGETVVRVINSKLQRDSNIKPRYKCAHLELSEILYERKRRSSDGLDEYLVGVKTKPGEGVFEMTVNGLEDDEKEYGPISRLNEYGNDSHCANRPSTKPFCFCETLYGYI